MKIAATLLTFVFLFALCTLSMAQMSTDQNDAYVTSKVNIWLALFFSVNLVATLAFWAALETPASLGLYAAAMIAFTVAAFLDLRSALRYCEPEEELPVSA